MDVIKSISYDQHEIIRNILALHANGKNIELDATYGKGNFYKKGITRPKYCFDIKPREKDVLQADVRHLPLPSESINVAMFDPPFLATKGPSLNTNKGNITSRMYGCYPDERSLMNMYDSALDELFRVLVPGGILIFKCQDKVSSGKQYFTHCDILIHAKQMKYIPRDLFILMAKSRLVADWQAKNQKNARKYHSYFWVFQTPL